LFSGTIAESAFNSSFGAAIVGSLLIKNPQEGNIKIVVGIIQILIIDNHEPNCSANTNSYNLLGVGCAESLPFLNLHKVFIVTLQFNKIESQIRLQFQAEHLLPESLLSQQPNWLCGIWLLLQIKVDLSFVNSAIE
jgi:hypothetical protein